MGGYDEIERLIPQREPIRLVDRLLEVDDNGAVTSLLVRDGLYLIDRQGRLTEPGLVEHIAQSASALLGCLALQAGQEEPPIGYIGEIRDFHCCPELGDDLRTIVTLEDVVGNIICARGETRVAGELIAEGRLKLSIHSSDQ